MKKIVLIGISLFALLAFTNTAYSGWFPPDVTSGQNLDPCSVINRVGINYPDKNVWIPVGPERTLEECMDRAEIDNYKYKYFSCDDQEEASDYNLRNILTTISNDEDRNFCSVGNHNGYDTALLLFQMKHVPSGLLFEEYSNPEYVDDNHDHIPTVINKPMTLSLEAGRQAILSDARLFWNYHHHHKNGSNNLFAPALVNDQISEFEDEVPFFKPENFRVHKKLTILDVENAYTVPIIVEGLASNKFALNFEGHSSDGEKASRIVIRGWDVDLKSGKGFLKTVGNTELKVDRTRIKLMNPIDGALFSFSPDTVPSFLPKHAHPASKDFGMEIVLGNKYPTVFEYHGVPTNISGLMAMAEGLRITFDLSPSGEIPIPVQVLDEDGKELLEPCTVVRKKGYDGNGAEYLKCDEGIFPTTDALPLYLVFEPEPLSGKTWTYNIYLDTSPIQPASPSDFPPLIVHALAKVENGKLKPSGARIVFDYYNLSEENEETTSECNGDPDKSDPGICGCGIADDDTDGDGTADCNDNCLNDPAKMDPGICGCGIPDDDTDGDGTADCIDNCPNDPAKTDSGVCGCGIADTDTDGDGTADCNEECEDGYTMNNDGDCSRIECVGIDEHFDEDQDGCVCNDGYTRDDNDFCVPDSDGGSEKESEKESESNSNGDFESGLNETVVCDEDETPFFGSCIPDSEPDNSDPKDRYAFGLKSGCSLIPSQNARSWAPLALVIFALLGLCLRRRFQVHPSA